MADQAAHPSSAEQRGTARWRTVDIVVTAVLGVAFGVVFWGWNLVAVPRPPPASGRCR